MLSNIFWVCCLLKRTLQSDGFGPSGCDVSLYSNLSNGTTLPTASKTFLPKSTPSRDWDSCATLGLKAMGLPPPTHHDPRHRGTEADDDPCMAALSNNCHASGSKFTLTYSKNPYSSYNILYILFHTHIHTHIHHGPWMFWAPRHTSNKPHSNNPAKLSFVLKGHHCPKISQEESTGSEWLTC